ncbi:hypothetical protein PPS11_01724 [Pseudomonas putida S11]|nr:hypothetical protein PPS11_01724 [Pseudomonas putida S11]
MQDDYKAQLTKATEGLHYCDLILTAQEADDLRALVKDLLASGKHPGAQWRVQNDPGRNLEQ